MKEVIIIVALSGSVLVVGIVALILARTMKTKRTALPLGYQTGVWTVMSGDVFVGANGQTILAGKGSMVSCKFSDSEMGNNVIRWRHRGMGTVTFSVYLMGTSDMVEMSGTTLGGEWNTEELHRKSGEQNYMLVEYVDGSGDWYLAPDIEFAFKK